MDPVWCLLPLRGVLFHPASEKEIVRDVTEKRLIHRVFIATQSPNRLPQRRRLFVMSQRNVCYIVFSLRHRAHVADLSFPCVTDVLLSSSTTCSKSISSMCEAISCDEGVAVALWCRLCSRPGAMRCFVENDLRSVKSSAWHVVPY